MDAATVVVADVVLLALVLVKEAVQVAVCLVRGTAREDAKAVPTPVERASTITRFLNRCPPEYMGTPKSNH